MCPTLGRNKEKHCADKLAERLVWIANCSFEKGEFSSVLRLSIVIPIYKNKGSLSSTYSPLTISIISTCTKEKLYFNRLCTFLTSNNFISDRQFGFKESISTVNAVFDILNDVVNSLDSSKYFLCLFLDLSKAFDVMDHNLYLRKLTF